MEKIYEEEKKEKELIDKRMILEGKAKILIETKLNLSNKEENYQAFYNPVQVFKKIYVDFHNILDV